MRLTALSTTHAVAAIITLSLVPLPTAPAAAQDYTGKQMSIVIGTGSGGGYDAYARLVARHLGRQLPGNPTIVANNMPGAGAIVAANWLFNVAPRDGTALGIIPGSAYFQAFLGHKQAKFDARQFNYLASLADYHGIAVVWTGGAVSSAADLADKELVVGGAGAGSDITIWPRVVQSMLGAKIKLVTGYIGTTGVYLAMERGEVQGLVGNDWDGVKTTKADWLREGKIKPILQIAPARHPDLPDVPTLLELARTERDRDVLDLFIARQLYSRPFETTPGVPEATVAQLRTAFERMVADPDFNADAKKSRLPIKFTTGADVQASVERIHRAPADIVQHAMAEIARAEAD